MSEQWEERYREKLRELIQKHGRKVETLGKYPQYDVDDDLNVSAYGWTDFPAEHHINGTRSTPHGGPCEWVVPEGAVAYEQMYSQFQDTFTENAQQVGVNVSGCCCRCGKYRDVILRWKGSFAEAIQLIMDVPNTARSVQL